MARDGIDREQALRRVRAQKTENYYRERCDRVLMNNGDAASFAKDFLNVIGGQERWTI